ncbi:MAG: DUF995 domain-containing protein [Rhodobacteraceae bacterium]|nr:DUF995 domain-containing protein [Paracoccaceae bacterium]
MKLFKTLAGAALALTVTLGALTTAAIAEPDKKNKLSGQQVTALYSGKTWIWSEGASYWGKGAEFQGIWKDSVAIGKWYATNGGQLCYEATWYSASSKKPVKRCWLHVTDSKGVLWKQDLKTKDWYKPKTEFAERVKSGNKIKGKVRKARKRLGV